MQRRTPRSNRPPTLDPRELAERTGHVGNVVLQVWSEWPSPERLKQTRDLVRAAHGEHPSKVALLLRVMDGCGVPDPRELRSVSRFLHEIEDEVHGVAIVLEGGGFWVSSMRAIFSSVVLMARSGPPTRIYVELVEASEAIHDLLDQYGAALVSTEAVLDAAIALGVPKAS